MKERSEKKVAGRIPSLTIGTWAFAGGKEWGSQERKTSIAVVHEALDLGLNFFDTAPAYGSGESETVLGAALKDRREEAYIATKVGPEDLAASDLRRSCEESLKRLDTDRIDLMQVHWPSREVPFQESVETLDTLCEEGKILDISVCNFGVQDLQDWLAVGGTATFNQLPYSLLWRAIEFEIVDCCVSNDTQILAYSPLMQGLLSGKFRNAEDVPDGRARSRHFASSRAQARHGEGGAEQATFEAIDRIRAASARLGVDMGTLALAWLRTRDAVASLIVGCRTVEQVRENADSLTFAFADEDAKEMDDATRELKELLGTNPDMWSAESRYR